MEFSLIMPVVLLIALFFFVLWYRKTKNQMRKFVVILTGIATFFLLMLFDRIDFLSERKADTVLIVYAMFICTALALIVFLEAKIRKGIKSE